MANALSTRPTPPSWYFPRPRVPNLFSLSIIEYRRADHQTGRSGCGMQKQVSRYEHLLRVIWALLNLLRSLQTENALCRGQDKTIWLWNAETGEPLQSPFEGHRDFVWSVVFSPDGLHIVSGSSDNTIRLWDAATGQSLRPPLHGRQCSVCSVAVSPDGECIVSGSVDWLIRLWCDSFTDTRTPFILPGRQAHCFGSADVRIRLFLLHSLQMESRLHRGPGTTRSGYRMLLPPLEGHQDWVFSVTFSSDGKRVVSGSHDRTIGRSSLSVSESHRLIC